MIAVYWFLCRSILLNCRIYRIFLAVAELVLFLNTALSQEIGAYKTVASGDFSNISTWGVWNGSIWAAATSKPTANQDIYIDQNHTLRLVGNEQVKSVFINAETGAGQKLNLNGFNLDIFGTLAAFSGAAPGNPDNAWNSQNWIGNSLSSTLTFRGSSRKILDKGSWSGQTTQSRFGVIFDPGPGIELVIEAPFKTLFFIVRSGSLRQKVDTSVNPNVCFTMSFNTESTVYGSGPFGDFTIEDGATFVSECNSNIINRSTTGSTSALNFDLRNGGTLILEGANPRIEAANFLLNGSVLFRGASGPKSFLSSSFADASTPSAVRHLELQSSQNLSLPAQLFLLGNLTKSGSGNFLTSGMHLIIFGGENQMIQGFPLVVQDLTLDKTGGIFFPKEDLSIRRNLHMRQGRMDLEGKNLVINTLQTGELTYLGGSWRNVGSLTLFGLPGTLTPSNASFPFEDVLNGGTRKVQLLGNSPGGSITIRFQEFKGATHDPNFTDSDGTPILYQLFSHFQFSGISASDQPIELRLSADDLIVDQVDDLRIVGQGQPAPGTHLPGSDPTLLWARRSLAWNELAGFNFTIGSYRQLSILPVTWLDLNVQRIQDKKVISWQVGMERENLLFEVYRSKGVILSWEKIGLVGSKGNSDLPVWYQFEDRTASRFGEYFYRIRQISLDGSESWSHVSRTLQMQEIPNEALMIYPNPYQDGPLKLFLSKDVEHSDAYLLMTDTQGKAILELKFSPEIPQEYLSHLAPGIYFLHLITPEGKYLTRFIRQ